MRPIFVMAVFRRGNGDGDESDSSSYTPSELHHVSTPQPNSSRSTGLEGDTSSEVIGPSNIPQITYLQSSIRISTASPTVRLLSRRVSSPNSIIQLSPAALPALLPPVHLLLSRLRDKVIEHKLRSRSGKSERYSARERRCREWNIWYAGKTHGCPKVN